jgi:hypothetical protein
MDSHKKGIWFDFRASIAEPDALSPIGWKTPVAHSEWGDNPNANSPRLRLPEH